MTPGAMNTVSRLPMLMSCTSLLWSVVALSGCGGATAAFLAPEPSLAPPGIPLPSSVSALAPARMEMSGNGTWMACFGVGVGGYTECAFRGAVHNAGTGCAIAIRGVTHFLDSNRQEMPGAAFPWTVDDATI